MTSSIPPDVISPSDDSGIALIETLLTEKFSGGLVGNGRAGHVRVVLPDGTSTFTGVERFIGTLNGRSGSFALTASGYTDVEGIVHGRWRVVEDSGTDQLAGLRGDGDARGALDWHSVSWPPRQPSVHGRREESSSRSAREGSGV